MNFFNHFNAPKRKGETNKMPSRTIPGQAISPIEIMKRFVNGQPIQGTSLRPVYSGEADLPDWQSMDLAEREEYRKNVAAKIAFMQSDLQRQEDERKQKEKTLADQAALLEAINKGQSTQQSTTQSPQS